MAERPEQLSDNDLYNLLAGEPESSRAAFEELYRRFGNRVYKYCIRIVGQRSLAEDLFQETFLLLFKSAGTPREMKNLQAYLFRIARNLCLNAKNDKHRQMKSVDELVEHELPHYPAGNDRADTKTFVKAALERLPDVYREALVLREYDGLSYAEIAEVLDVSHDIVRIRIYRAKKMIRRYLAPVLNELLN